MIFGCAHLETSLCSEGGSSQVISWSIVQPEKKTKLKDLDPTKKVGDSSRRKPGQALTLKEKKDYWRMYENILEACKEEERPQSKV